MEVTRPNNDLVKKVRSWNSRHEMWLVVRDIPSYSLIKNPRMVNCFLKMVKLRKVLLNLEIQFETKISKLVVQIIL